MSMYFCGIRKKYWIKNLFHCVFYRQWLPFTSCSWLPQHEQQPPRLAETCCRDIWLDACRLLLAGISSRLWDGKSRLIMTSWQKHHWWVEETVQGWFANDKRCVLVSLFEIQYETQKKIYFNQITCLVFISLMLSFLDTRNKTVVYTRWGKKTCPSNAELVLSGKNG